MSVHLSVDGIYLSIYGQSRFDFLSPSQPNEFITSSFQERTYISAAVLRYDMNGETKTALKSHYSLSLPLSA